MCGRFVAPSTGSLLSGVPDGHSRSINDMEAAHIDLITFRKIDEVFTYAVHFTLEGAVGEFVIHYSCLRHHTVPVEIVNNETVGSVKVDALDANSDLTPTGWLDEARLDVVVDLDDVVLAELVDVDAGSEPDLHVEWPTLVDLVSLNLCLNINS